MLPSWGLFSAPRVSRGGAIGWLVCFDSVVVVVDVVVVVVVVGVVVVVVVVVRSSSLSAAWSWWSLWPNRS